MSATANVPSIKTFVFRFRFNETQTGGQDGLRMVRLRKHETILSDNTLFAMCHERYQPTIFYHCCFANLGLRAIMYVYLEPRSSIP